MALTITQKGKDYTLLLYSHSLVFSRTFSRTKRKTPGKKKKKKKKPSIFFQIPLKPKVGIFDAAAIFRGGVLGGSVNPIHTADSKLEPFCGDHGGVFKANRRVHAQSLPSHTSRLFSNLQLHSQSQQHLVESFFFFFNLCLNRRGLLISRRN